MQKIANWILALTTFIGFLVGGWQYVAHSGDRATIEELRLALADTTRSAAYYKLGWEVCRQNQDTIAGIGEYHVDTVKIIRNVPASPVGTLETAGAIQTPLLPYITFDTTKYFGDNANPLGVRVWGKLFTDEAMKDSNKVLIQAIYPPVLNSATTVLKKRTWQKGVDICLNNVNDLIVGGDITYRGIGVRAAWNKKPYLGVRFNF